MQLIIIVKVALRSLYRTLLRSSLTMLGIIIGVAAVIAMVSIGNGARARVERSLANVDANRSTFTASMPRRLWFNGNAIPVPSNDGLTLNDYAAIQSEIHDLTAASVEILISDAKVDANGRRSDARLRGVDVDGWKLSSRHVLQGAPFGKADVSRAATVCVLSEFVATNLFGEEAAVGRIIRIKGAPFIVIAVVSDMTFSETQPAAGDTTVLIPYTSLLRRLHRDAQIGITLKAQNPEKLSKVQQQVSNLLERQRGKRQADFVASNMGETLQNYREGSQTMVVLLGSIAAISLVVGGIGIMNIMLVSVTERTREIGIRLAIGTRERDVLRQFLIEAMILSVLGGAAGILLGTGVAYLITYINGWPTQVTLSSVLGASLCSAAIGICFGYYPARRAARMDPIEALRAEG